MPEIFTHTACLLYKELLLYNEVISSFSSKRIMIAQSLQHLTKRFSEQLVNINVNWKFVNHALG